FVLDGLRVPAGDLELPQLPADREGDEPAEADQEEAAEGHGSSRRAEKPTGHDPWASAGRHTPAGSSGAAGSCGARCCSKNSTTRRWYSSAATVSAWLCF